MTYQGVLPGKEVLARLRRRHRKDNCPVRHCRGTKHTYDEIAVAFGVTKSAVYQAMRRHGLTDEGSRIDHIDTIPWSLKKEHRYKHPANMLRQLSRTRAGDPNVLPEQRRMLIRWLTKRIDEGTVATYDPHTPPNEASDTGGWSYVPAVPGDAPLIRLPANAPSGAYTDPMEAELWELTNLTADRRRELIAEYRRRQGRDERGLDVSIIRSVPEVS